MLVTDLETRTIPNQRAGPSEEAFLSCSPTFQFPSIVKDQIHGLRFTPIPASYPQRLWGAVFTSNLLQAIQNSRQGAGSPVCQAHSCQDCHHWQ